MKEEIKADWTKVPLIQKIFVALAALSVLFIIISLIVGIWSESYPAFKSILTGLIIFIVSAWLVRTDILDENGDVKEIFRKNDNG
jgi:xanthine/uracil permease